MPATETTGVKSSVVLDWIQLVIENNNTVEVFKAGSCSKSCFSASYSVPAIKVCLTDYWYQGKRKISAKLPIQKSIPDTNY